MGGEALSGGRDSRRKFGRGCDDRSNPARARRLRRFEVKFERFLQVCEGLFFALALAGDIDLKALRDVPRPLRPDGRSKWPLHDHTSFTRRRAFAEEGAAVTGIGMRLVVRLCFQHSKFFEDSIQRDPVPPLRRG